MVFDDLCEQKQEKPHEMRIMHTAVITSFQSDGADKLLW